MFSKACEYAIRATIYIGQQSNKNAKVNLKEVAQAIESPVAFTGKILQSLVKEGIILSTKGVSGGYTIDLSTTDNLTLLRIVKAIDGDTIYNSCGLGLDYCDENEPCPLHNEFVVIRKKLQHMLSETTIESLNLNFPKNTYFLKR